MSYLCTDGFNINEFGLKPHGNSKDNINNYMRKPPQLRKDISDQVMNKKSDKVYQEMLKDLDITDEKQRQM